MKGRPTKAQRILPCPICGLRYATIRGLWSHLMFTEDKLTPDGLELVGERRLRNSLRRFE